jgi:methyl-accepting chemotaxis protein
LILVVMAIIGISGVVEVVLTAVLYHTGGLAGAHAWGQMGKTSSSERWILLWPVAGVLTITLTLALVVWLIRGPVLRPLAAVSEAVEGIAGGDLTVHLPSSPVREIAEVTAAQAGRCHRLAQRNYRLQVSANN